jgi:hypothetical protein
MPVSFRRRRVPNRITMNGPAKAGPHAKITNLVYFRQFLNQAHLACRLLSNNVLQDHKVFSMPNNRAVHDAR